MTQDQVSGEAGITTTQISRIENGRANPEAETLVRLAEALGVPVAALVAGIPGPHVDRCTSSLTRPRSRAAARAGPRGPGAAP
jgi:transcriptional regulator with XRE-family HTH domain